MNEPIVRTSISLPEPVLKRGQRNARRQLRNFSSYLADLISRDAETLANRPEKNGAASVAPNGK